MKFNFDKPKNEEYDALGTREEFVSSEKVKEIFDSFALPEKSAALTISHEYIELLRNVLPPQTKLVLPGKEIYLSEVVQSGKARTFAIAYIENSENNFVPRTFFMSRSQGVWRVLMGYVEDNEGNGLWHHKGVKNGEDSLLLPAGIQKKLSQEKDMTAMGGLKNVTHKLFYGAVPISNGRDDLPEEYDNLVAKQGTPIFSEKFERVDNVPNPDTVHIDFENQPNFGALLDTWQYTSDIYGQVKNDVFLSQNEEFRYIFSHNHEGKSWVSGVENMKSSITDLGVKDVWVDAGVLTTPAYEYKTRVKFDEYFNNDDTYQNYADIYQNYLSHIPVIQEYNKKMGYISNSN